MRIPHWIQGVLFGPVLIGLTLVLKVFCSIFFNNSGTCIADPLSVPIFLPLIFVYKVFGVSEFMLGNEFLLVFLYWALVGAIIGLIYDLYKHQSQY